MKKNSLIIWILILLSLLFSCSSNKSKDSVSISTASIGEVKNSHIDFPLVLIDKIESKESMIQKHGDDVVVVHSGHFLKATAPKEENIKILNDLVNAKIDYVNLAIEDFIIADQKGIDFTSFSIKFINSSVVNLNEDNIIESENIKPFYIHNDVAIMGLSDKNIDKLLSLDKFIVSDHVLALLRARKIANKLTTPPTDIVIVHTMPPEEMNEILDRLPPNFISSLAD